MTPARVWCWAVHRWIPGVWLPTVDRPGGHLCVRCGQEWP